MRAFLIALVIVFIAEMGDKTQLITLSFATRYRPRVVLAGVLLATLLIHLLSVTVGEAVGLALPVFWINLIAGLCFIGFGIWMLRPATPDDKESAPPTNESRFGPFLTIALAFFLAEFGDRTMIATAMIAGREHNFIGVWLGSTAGMLGANILAIWVGRMLGHRLSNKFVQYGTALTFIISGALAIVAAFTQQ